MTNKEKVIRAHRKAAKEYLNEKHLCSFKGCGICRLFIRHASERCSVCTSSFTPHAFYSSIRCLYRKNAATDSDNRFFNKHALVEFHTEVANYLETLPEKEFYGKFNKCKTAVPWSKEVLSELNRIDEEVYKKHNK